MTAPWRDRRLSLGARCILWSRNEARSRVHAPPAPAPNTSPRIAEYFDLCTRRVGSLERHIGITAGNWCAAFASAALDACLLPGEQAPHGRRVGVVELVADAQKLGRWHPVREVIEGDWAPWLGDLAIWDRSERERPETAWWRHVNRLTHWVSGELDSFHTIGGNEGRRIVETSGAPKRLTNDKLLGFISYYEASEQGFPTDHERAETERLCVMFAEEHRRTLPRAWPTE